MSTEDITDSNFLPFYNKDTEFKVVDLDANFLRLELFLDTKKHVFIKHHPFEDEYLVLANMVFEILAQSAIYHSTLRMSGCLFIERICGVELMRIIKFLKNETSKKLSIISTLNGAQDANECYHVTILSNKENKSGEVIRSVIHAKADVWLTPRQGKGYFFSHQKEKELPDNSYFIPKDILYSSCYKHRGNLFQCLSSNFEVAKGLNGISSTCDILGKETELIRGNVLPFLTLPCAGDAAIQLQSLLARLSTKSNRIPVHIDEITFYERGDSPSFYKIHVTSLSNDQEVSVDNIYVVSEENLVVSVYRGCKIQRKSIPYESTEFDSVIKNHMIS